MRLPRRFAPLLILISVYLIAYHKNGQTEGNWIFASGGPDMNNYIQSTDFGKYVGCTVSELISDLKVPYQKAYPIDEPPFRLAGFGLQFPGEYVVSIYAGELRYTQEFSERREWDFASFSKEKISRISVRRIGSTAYQKTFSTPSGSCKASG